MVRAQRLLLLFTAFFLDLEKTREALQFLEALVSILEVDGILPLMFYEGGGFMSRSHPQSLLQRQLYIGDSYATAFKISQRFLLSVQVDIHPSR